MIWPAGPLPATNCSSIPMSQARLRTAGAASGFSPGSRNSAREAAPLCCGAGETERAAGEAAGAEGVRAEEAAGADTLAAPAATRCGSGTKPCGTSAGSSAAGAAAVAGAAAGAAAAAAGFAASAFRLPAPSISRRISSAPTASDSPTLPPSATTVPCTGDGISTVALSVMTSARIWSSVTASPGWTRQATTSHSAIPSPTSGILMM